jgi:hypothetical protein
MTSLRIGRHRRRATPCGTAAAVATFACLALAPPAAAQEAAAPVAAPQNQVVDETKEATASPALPVQQDQGTDSGSQTDILSRNTVSILLDGRIAFANGARSWVDGGLGKTRFSGTANGEYKAQVVPVEADLIWAPRFTGSLSANVSAAWQRDQENGFDLLEAFVNYLPQSTGKVSFSARAGLMWPEISLEHSTGGAWTVVNTITPSAINAWVGEEVKVLGAEGTLHASLGKHEVSLTAAAFGFNDTSGTLLSFRGWALHDEKATGFGHFPLPPLNSFIAQLQEGQTRSLIEIDKRVGFYGRLDWRPPAPFGVAVFYYDNRGDPKAFEATGQWGWRTRFWNVGFNADLGPNTKLLAQGMTGSTIMGFETGGVPWVHTIFRSAYVLVTQQVGKVAVTGRVEGFGTREHGSRMSPDESEDGWALTAAGRYSITNNLTALLEVLHVRSDRGTRVNLGIPAFEKQTVFQASLRFRI